MYIKTAFHHHSWRNRMNDLSANMSTYYKNRLKYNSIKKTVFELNKCTGGFWEIYIRIIYYMWQLDKHKPEQFDNLTIEHTIKS